MKRDVHRFTNEADWLKMRLVDVTSTESCALLGASQYMTPYKLWYIKKNGIMGKRKVNERMSWGIRLQDTIAAGIAEDHGFNITKMDEYIRIPELRVGSSFDYKINDDTIFEIKNVSNDAFRNWWVFDDKDASAPPHIEIQVQHQLAVSGFKVAYIGALVGGNDAYLLRRERNEPLIAQIFERCAAFWESVDKNEMPEPDMFKDNEVIRDIYCHAEPGKVTLSNDGIDALAAEYNRTGEEIRKLERERTGLKSRLLMAVGDHEKVIGSDYTISANMVGPAHVSYDREGYRNFRVTFKRGKGSADVKDAGG